MQGYWFLLAINHYFSLCTEKGSCAMYKKEYSDQIVHIKVILFSMQTIYTKLIWVFAVTVSDNMLYYIESLLLIGYLRINFEKLLELAYLQVQDLPSNLDQGPALRCSTSCTVSIQKVYRQLQAESDSFYTQRVFWPLGSIRALPGSGSFLLLQSCYDVGVWRLVA